MLFSGVPIINQRSLRAQLTQHEQSLLREGQQGHEQCLWKLAAETPD